MEVACGPSDRWIIRDGMHELEISLRAQFINLSSSVEYQLRRKNSMIQWLRVAYKINDNTYLSFTNGKPLRRGTVSYPAEEPIDMPPV